MKKKHRGLMVLKPVEGSLVPDLFSKLELVPVPREPVDEHKKEEKRKGAKKLRVR